MHSATRRKLGKVHEVHAGWTSDKDKSVDHVSGNVNQP